MKTKAIDRTVYSAETTAGGVVAPAYTRVLARDAKLAESWYRDAIFQRPELVIGVCREARLVDAEEEWRALAREFQTASGPIDVLLVSSRGRIAIVETKLAYNPERRREVVAQVLDYALALRDASAADLRAPDGDDPIDIARAFRAGRFLLIIAGDQTEPRALLLGEAVLGRHLTNEWDLAMVDLNLFQSSSSTGHILIPELRGTVVQETRQVVRVTVEGGNATVRTEPVVDDPDSRVAWNEERFLEAAKRSRLSPAFQTVVSRLMGFVRDFPDTATSFGIGKTASVTLKVGGSSILSLNLDGRGEVKPREYIDRGLGPKGAPIYLGEVARLWGPEFTDGWKRPVTQQIEQHGAAILNALEAALEASGRPRGGGHVVEP